ncbi:kynurenine/alpha-aminoadipate aminotransferase mitochondrial kat/aadat kynurenine--oxoglutarate transaminase ii kynurenine aminotransferase ii kynurenine--oxoglutarate aminotransferase ii transaminase [Plakobranchus ocellatus]|uniref:Kynurenine/alpha-aminoadipate aminotransferase mitochondrial kat/aadat kynurenine--oxoglutarate transaminase ii kynurenine aminotransferase ii kynurenine--oxoglutarate aminotransferase ii transaminase n=1 Tax=Plakobranchus ocellatus TaxID=259542 RepID=A0AAV4BED6_9GAST|nr:kynurenine/alpha-aminoadipate aminotransferase mitochondrial kat/aadat kynurenine--oxoglutarate transaminase ii kynurenine aminotransferase ii kynurenine--oxoglutarate aminotransferase ii transaminase [Plakobranchus ocellatus]
MIVFQDEKEIIACDDEEAKKEIGHLADFGDYCGKIYSMQTTEGEQISQLIARYINIILKKKQARDHLATESDSIWVVEGENVQARQSNIFRRGLIFSVSIMKYFAIFFAALFVAAIADDTKECLIEGDFSLDGIVDCSSYYNTEPHPDSGFTVCCEDEDRKPDN